MHGRSTTGEASEYFKKTLLGDLFVMTYVTTQSRENMSLAVKNTALWAHKVHVGLGVVKLLVHGISIVWTPYLAILWYVYIVCFVSYIVDFRSELVTIRLSVGWKFSC